MSKARSINVSVPSPSSSNNVPVEKKTTEVTSARSKLDGVLQNLVEKKEESPSKVDEEVWIKLEPEDNYFSDSGPSTPKKGLGSSSKSRKRKRKDETDEMQPHYHHTYVMKLFDRSVDLAQFDDQTPLYPICRAWMRNQPHNQSLGPRSETTTPEPIINFDPETTDRIPKDIYRMPPGPNRPFDHVKGEYVDPRIPVPVPQPDEHIDTLNTDPEAAPEPENLLLEHMARWKKVRQSWRDSALDNEERYTSSMFILKNMFEYQLEHSP
ncbi:unnamed protein product [Owenia fusiformis]|uniref:Uncharacterized protein n=1 Tax=Owenia fusiformis TaxID=6347 RepID=A0A8J1T6Z1_OWEFU|nr:unnamed protein product [Owenia fusiformis]